MRDELTLLMDELEDIERDLQDFDEELRRNPPLKVFEGTVDELWARHELRRNIFSCKAELNQRKGVLREQVKPLLEQKLKQLMIQRGNTTSYAAKTNYSTDSDE